MPDLYEILKESYAPRDSLIMSFELYDANFEKELDEIKSKNQFSEEKINYLRYIKRLNEALFTWGKASSSKEKPVKDAFSDFYNDAYLDFVSYKDFLEYAFGFYYEVAENIPRVYGGIGTKIDSRETFKKIIKDTEIPPKTKNYVLKFTLTKLLDQFGEEEGYTYVKEYEKLAEESFSREDEKNIKYVQDELFLKDLSGNQVTFQALLQKYKGKVIYVDFWASWCMPCREQMPKGKELHKKFKDKDIVFLYFALNDNEEAWTKACKKLEIEENSYFVINPKTARFIADNKIKSIPRYFLFDKTGMLIDRNAPRPKDDNVEIIFDKYLKE
ncbi:thiol-disulfide isomerase/thioredoxin [Balneicella halophila]|uniref:Thiol-disulfide isomerase/thioredoxin n=1 Tax=Balneicella halophila TaxID=1537566 RepID=A0A7L4USX4_BALHA|nr:TlpA disulfide reductase family protein [Balneicella halophila]PVX52581.1 thiol-disulfide isomerase/thioredoxin [Balneicella halophila]